MKDLVMEKKRRGVCEIKKGKQSYEINFKQ